MKHQMCRDIQLSSGGNSSFLTSLENKKLIFQLLTLLENRGNEKGSLS